MINLSAWRKGQWAKCLWRFLYWKSRWVCLYQSFHCSQSTQSTALGRVVFNLTSLWLHNPYPEGRKLPDHLYTHTHRRSKAKIALHEVRLSFHDFLPPSICTYTKPTRAATHISLESWSQLYSSHEYCGSVCPEITADVFIWLPNNWYAGSTHLRRISPIILSQGKKLK